jgi:hypothetical protein
MFPVTTLSKATSGFACGVVRWDIDTWKITAERSGEVIPADKLNAFFDSCVTRGVHVGRNEQAFRQSRKDVQAFVQSVLIDGN